MDRFIGVSSLESLRSLSSSVHSRPSISPSYSCVPAFACPHVRFSRIHFSPPLHQSGGNLCFIVTYDADNARSDVRSDLRDTALMFVTLVTKRIIMIQIFCILGVVGMWVLVQIWEWSSSGCHGERERKLVFQSPGSPGRGY